MARGRTRKAELERQLEQVLVESLRAAGWTVQRISRGAADLIASRGDDEFICAVKVASVPTRPAIEGMLANAVLVSTRAARDRGARPLAVVGSDRLSSRMLAELRGFASRWIDPEVAHGWVDPRGTLELHGSPLLERVQWAAKDTEHRDSPRRKHAVFSDLGQWIFKVLLAPSIPGDLLTAPRERPKNVRHLAHIAGVSEPTAHRVITAAKDAGLVRDGGRTIELVNPWRLLRRWRVEGAALPREVSARWIVAKRDADAALGRALRLAAPSDSARLPSACLGLFAAARALNLGFVQGIPSHLMMRDGSRKSIEHLGLRIAGPRETAEVFVRQPTFVESTFRGCVRRDRLWVTDVVQTWLDASDHPARGREQAEHIEREVFVPAFGPEDP